MKRSKARTALGAPTVESARYMRWCMTGGGSVGVAFSAAGERARALVVVTDAPPFDAAGLRTGSKSSKAHRRLRHERTVAHHVLGVARRRDRLVVGLAKRRVAWLASASRRVSGARAAKLAARALR
jgi:hypothetical protein